MSATVRKKALAEGQSSWVEGALNLAAERRAKASSRVQELALEAAAVWNKVLFPTPSMEEWKYTNPEGIATGSFSLPSTGGSVVSKQELEKFCIPGLKVNRIVFVDGAYAENLSELQLQSGVTVHRVEDQNLSLVGSLRAHEGEPFAALATALLSDGLVLVIDRGVVAERPLHIIHITTKGAERCVFTPRLFIEAGESSQVTVVESHVSLDSREYLSLPVSEIRAASGAIVDVYTFQNESTAAFVVANTTVEQGRDSTVRNHIFSFGGKLVRNNVTVKLSGSNGNAVLNGLSVLCGSQHVDNATMIHHIEPSSESREHFKGIYSDTSRGVFSGTITVDQIAQKTNAFQSNQALLLSPNASIETRPQLKIWADDVKCTHGATVGQLDAEAMYYLRSRGIDRETARNFLVHAFASEVLTSVQLEPLKQYVEGVLTQKLEGETPQE